MSRVRYVGDEPREISMLPSGTARIVEPDQVFEVPDEHDESYACQPAFYEVEGMPWSEDDGKPEPEPVKKTAPAKTTAKEKSE